MSYCNRLLHCDNAPLLTVVICSALVFKFVFVLRVASFTSACYDDAKHASDCSFTRASRDVTRTSLPSRFVSASRRCFDVDVADYVACVTRRRCNFTRSQSGGHVGGEMKMRAAGDKREGNRKMLTSCDYVGIAAVIVVTQSADAVASMQ